MCLTARNVLELSGLGFGGLALNELMHEEKLRAANTAARHDLLPRLPHFAPRAKAVIMLVQNGGPSQMDLFDPKPELAKRAGQTMTVETFQQGNSDKLMASPLEFQKYGQCGMEMGTLLPRLGSVADDLCLVRSAYSEHNNHTEALVLLNTGKIF